MVLIRCYNTGLIGCLIKFGFLWLFKRTPKLITENEELHIIGKRTMGKNERVKKVSERTECTYVLDRKLYEQQQVKEEGVEKSCFLLDQVSLRYLSLTHLAKVVVVVCVVHGMIFRTQDRLRVTPLQQQQQQQRQAAVRTVAKERKKKK